MGSITQALRSAASGLSVNQEALNLIANNTANVNTVGYSRKVVSTEAVAVAGVGAGVQISAISRLVDEGLMKTLRIENGQLNTMTSKTDYYSRVQDVFGSPLENSSLSHILESFGESLEALATSPEQTVNKVSAVRLAEDFILKLNSMTETIQDLRLQADSEIAQITVQINEITANIDQLNDDIISNGSVGRDVTDLKDQRDLQVDKLSKLIDIRYFSRNDGDMIIFTSAGRTLVDTVPPQVTHTAASSVAATTTHAEADFSGIYVGDAVARNDITTELREGTLKGLVDIRDSILPNLQSQIDELAVELKNVMNQIHNRGSMFPGLQTMTGSRDIIDSTVQKIQLDPTSNVDDTTIILMDSSGEQTAVTTLNTIMQDATYGAAYSSRGTGNDWTIAVVNSQLQSWLQANGATGATAAVNASGKMEINLNTTSLNLTFRDETASTNGSTLADAEIGFDSDGDGNVDETVSGFSNFFGLNDFFSNNKADNTYESDVLDSSFVTSAATLNFRDSTGLLTGSPLTVPSGTSLTALATLITNDVSNMTASVVPDGSGYRLRMSHDQGSSTIITQASTDTLLSDITMHVADVGVASTMTVRSDISDSPGLVSTGRAQWDSSRGAAGEYFMSVGDNSTITELASSFNSNQSFEKSGGLPAVSYSFTQYAAAIVATNSAEAGVNSRNIESQEALTNSLQFKSDSVRGVNLDEEMANLIVFEQAFSAAARVISVIQRMMDALERAVA